MSELTARGKMFRDAIADFINERRDTKLKGKENDAAAAAKYEYATWLADAASRAHNLQAVTHPIKFTHSGIKGASSFNYEANGANHPEIGTHSLIQDVPDDFAITDAKHLDVYSLLKATADGKPLSHWLRLQDNDLLRALNPDPATADALMAAFCQVLSSNAKPKSNTLAKQVYWLVGDEPEHDTHYHLLQPMFSSSLEHVVHQEIRDARDASFAARGTKKQKATFGNHSTYPNLVARTLGGANAQNISSLNKVRGGVNYLLPSLPPAAWKRSEGASLLKLDSVFAEKRGAFFWFGNVRHLVRTLANFLKANPDSTMDTRNRREAIEQALGDELALFGVSVRGRYSPGWTRDTDCHLPECEQLWLDPGRYDLEPRDDPDHPEWHERDIAFQQAYDRGDWADAVATRFGLWLNGQLRAHAKELVTLSAPEMRHFAHQAVLEVAWPLPLQRRATEDIA